MRIVIRIALALIVLGVMFIYFGWKERSVAVKASQSPERIALAELLKRGADGNPNIILTDFVPCENYVYEEDKSRWTGAWVPVVPAEGNHPRELHAGPVGDVRALIFTTMAGNEGELYRRCGKRELPALVVNNIVSLKSEYRDLLQQRYPGSNFDKCLIIQEGREPASDTKLWAMLGGGAAATILGLCLAGVFAIRAFSGR